MRGTTFTFSGLVDRLSETVVETSRSIESAASEVVDTAVDWLGGTPSAVDGSFTDELARITGPLRAVINPLFRIPSTTRLVERSADRESSPLADEEDLHLLPQILEAVIRDPASYADVDDDIRSDREFALAAVRANPGCLQYVDESFRADLAFIREALCPGDSSVLLDNVGPLQWVAPEIREPLLREALGQLADSGFRLEGLEDIRGDGYIVISQFLFGRDDVFLHADSLGSLLTLAYTERLYLSQQLDPERPIAVVVYPASDYNGAFNAAAVMRDLTASPFQVLYSEADSDQDIRRILSAIHSISGRRVHTVVLAGHGTATTLRLNERGFWASISDYLGITTPDEEHVDLSDFEAGDFDGIQDFIEEDGQVILWSCSNGEGGAMAQNLANAFEELLPGRRIYSTQVPSNIDWIEVASDLSLDVEWHGHSSYVAGEGEGRGLSSDSWVVCWIPQTDSRGETFHVGDCVRRREPHGPNRPFNIEAFEIQNGRIYAIRGYEQDWETRIPLEYLELVPA